jgi:hypothetical protein
MWHRSYVKKILENEAVIGTAIPHIIEHLGDSRVRTAQEPLRNYFPAIIHEDTFVQIQLQQGTGRAPVVRSGSKLQNIFASLARCPLCEGSMTRVTKGPSGGRAYLVCAKAKGGAGCVYHAVDQKVIESAFVKQVHWIIDSAPVTDQEESIDDDLSAIETALYDLEREIANILDVIVGNPSQALAGRLRLLENQAEDLKKERNQLQVTRAGDSRHHIARRLTELVHAVDTRPLDRARINALMRQLFSSVVVDYYHGFIECYWQHTGTASFIEGPVSGSVGDEPARRSTGGHPPLG